MPPKKDRNVRRHTIFCHNANNGDAAKDEDGVSRVRVIVEGNDQRIFWQLKSERKQKKYSLFSRKTMLKR